MSGSPAARTPHDVCGSPALTRETNALNDSGCGQRADSPQPDVSGRRCQRDDVKCRLLVGMRGAHRREHLAPRPRRRDDLDPVLDHSLHGADAADSRCGPVVRQELAGAGDAPAALGIVADSAGAGRKNRRPHRLRVLRRHEDHPLVQIGHARARAPAPPQRSARARAPTRRTPPATPSRRWYAR